MLLEKLKAGKNSCKLKNKIRQILCQDFISGQQNH